MFTDAIEPLFLICRECPPGAHCRERLLDALGRSEERTLHVCGVLHHRNDVYQRLVKLNFIRLLQVLGCETLGRGQELRSQLGEGGRAPLLGPIKKNANRFYWCRILAYEFAEGGEIIVRLVFLTASATHPPCRTDRVLGFGCNKKNSQRTRVRDKELLEILVS